MVALVRPVAFSMRLYVAICINARASTMSGIIVFSMLVSYIEIPVQSGLTTKSNRLFFQGKMKVP